MKKKKDKIKLLNRFFFIFSAVLCGAIISLDGFLFGFFRLLINAIIALFLTIIFNLINSRLEKK